MSRNLPAAGASGLILGEIFGRKAGDIVAEEVLCRFLLARPPRFSTLPGFAKVSWEAFLTIAPLGVLAALVLADLDNRVGVLSPDAEFWPASAPIKPACTGGAAASGNMISSIGSSRSCEGMLCSIFVGMAWLLGILIKVAGVTGLLV
jgi:hypothetical protein